TAAACADSNARLESYPIRRPGSNPAHVVAPMQRCRTGTLNRLVNENWLTVADISMFTSSCNSLSTLKSNTELWKLPAHFTRQSHRKLIRALLSLQTRAKV